MRIPACVEGILALAVVISAFEVEVTPLIEHEVLLQSNMKDEPEEGTNVALCWRIKNLARSNGNREGLEWALSSLRFYTQEDCSGAFLNGTAFSSGDAKVSDPAGRDGASQHAFDGNSQTVWQAPRLDPGEYIGLKLAEAKEVKCMKVKQDGQNHGVRTAVLEKSPNCQEYGRVAEFPSFPDSYEEEKTFPVASLSRAPAGVFQLRSRSELGKCIGLEVPDAEIEDVANWIPQKSFENGAQVEIQTCSMPTIPQYFFFDPKSRLAAAQDPLMLMTIPDAEAKGAEGQESPQSPKEGGTVVMNRCENDCPLLNGEMQIVEKDGFIKHTQSSKFILEPKEGKFKKATPIVTSECADGDIANCADKTFAQFDLVPLFTVVPGKKAVNCAPYSHTHSDNLKPKMVESEAQAQQLCAADKKCKVYMYVEPDAADGTADERGHAWFCEALDVVYSGKEGFKLGFRAHEQNFVEEEKK